MEAALGGLVTDIYGAHPYAVVSAIVVLFLTVVLYYSTRRRSLPGPRGLPYLGLWPFLKDDGCHLQLQDYMKKYGEVYGFTFTGQYYIHLGTIKAIKEAHLNKADCFTQRYSNFSTGSLIFDNGLVLTNGEKWKHLRKFFVQSFREFGLYSKELGGDAGESVGRLVEDLRRKKGSPVNIIEMMTVGCSSVMNKLLFNESGISVEELVEINKSYGDILGNFAGTGILLIGKFAWYVMMPLMSNTKSIMTERKKIDDVFRRIIRRHEENFDETDVRDLIDSYLKERNERKRKGDPSYKYFSTDSTLISTLLQFVGDGILSVAVFMGYFVYALLEHPEEQEKIFDELTSVVGPNRQVTLEDRNKLPYVNAFMQEVMRTSDFFPLFPSLLCTKETTLNGYRIPKGSISLMNFWAAQHDPKVYRDPERFNPSRYIATAGKKKEEPPILFGIGKRSCAGEQYTMMLMFLFLTSVVKNFRLSAPEKLNKRDFFEGKMKICAHPRSNK